MPNHERDWWEAPPHPAFLLATGFALGPHALEVLRPSTLQLLAPMVPLGLTALVILTALRRKPVAPLDLLIVAAVALLLTLLGNTVDWSSLANRSWRAVEACGAAALIGVAGVLLLRSDGPTARRVFVLALVLLLAGIADFAAAPALATGAVAATMWRRMSEPVVAAVTRDVEYVARPLATGLLVITGAGLWVSETTFLFAVAAGLAVLVARRGIPMAAGTAGIYTLAVAIDISRGLHAGFAPIAQGAVVALCLIQATEFIWGVDRASGIAQGAIE